MKKLLEKRKNNGYLTMRERAFISNFLRNRHWFESLSELMDGEHRVHTLIWLKGSGAYGQIKANPGYY